MTPPAPMLSDLLTFGLGLILSVLLVLAMRWHIGHTHRTGEIFHRVAPVRKSKNPVFFRIHVIMTWLGMFIGIGFAVVCLLKLIETATLLLG